MLFYRFYCNLLNMNSDITSTKKALKNVAWLFGEKFITMGLSLMVSVVLARYLGASDFGKLNYLLSFIIILTSFSALGLNSIVVRELVNKKVETGIVLGTSLSLRVLGGVLGVFSTILVCLLSSDGFLVQSTWLILAAIGCSFSSMLIFDFYFQSIVQSHYVVKARTIVLILVTSINLFAVFLQISLSIFLFIIVIEPILTAIVLFIFFKLNISKPVSFKYDASYAKELLSQSKWLIFSGFMAVVYLKIDQLMIGELLGSKELGVYSVAVRISEVWYFFPTAIVASFYPKILKSRTDPVVYKYNLQRLCDVLFWFGFLVAFVLTFISSLIINVLYGDEYTLASSVLSIHVWAGVFIFMRALLSKWLIAERLLKFSLLTQGIGAVSNVILNYIWIPQFGILGAAWATIISYAFSSYVVLWFHHKTLVMAQIMTRVITLPYRLIKL